MRLPVAPLQLLAPQEADDCNGRGGSEEFDVEVDVEDITPEGSSAEVEYTLEASLVYPGTSSNGFELRQQIGDSIFLAGHLQTIVFQPVEVGPAASTFEMDFPNTGGVTFNGPQRLTLLGLGTCPGQDSDGDGIADVTEDANHNGVFDEDQGETDLNNSDTDDDGVYDGFEDLDRDGTQDADETDPRTPDSDGDDATDGEEDTNRNGVYEENKDASDPLDPESRPD